MGQQPVQKYRKTWKKTGMWCDLPRGTAGIQAPPCANYEFITHLGEPVRSENGSTGAQDIKPFFPETLSPWLGNQSRVPSIKVSENPAKNTVNRFWVQEIITTVNF